MIKTARESVRSSVELPWFVFDLEVELLEKFRPAEVDEERDGVEWADSEETDDLFESETCFREDSAAIASRL